MKKIISKILIIFIILITLFEFIYSSNISLAIEPPKEETINKVANLAGGIVSIVYWPKRILAVALAFIFDIITADIAETSGVNFGDEGVFSIITPFDIFFNKYKLLDVNFFDVDGAGDKTLTYSFRTAVSGWYYAMRLIASGILLVILVYVGIRMALSTVADEKAKYKKMLVDWVCSLLLIFVLQYITVFIIYSNNAIVEALRSTLSDSTVEDSIGDMMVDIGLKAITGVGIPSIVAVIVFVIIVFQTIAFLIAYISRMIKVGFLIIISPLISLTYTIDKMGDGKAQALGNWLKEFIFTILIQPFHCIMYLAFVRTAFSLIVGEQDVSIFQAFTDIPALFTDGDFNQIVNGALAILCLKFIKDGEDIVRKIFGFQDDNSSTSFAAGMAVSMLAVSNAKKIGSSARKGINFAKSKSGALVKAIGNDARNGKFGKRAQNLEKNLTEKADAAKQKFDQFNKDAAEGNKGKFLKTAYGAKNKVSGFKSSVKGNIGKFKSSKLGGFISRHNSLASTLGLMGMAMAYGSGNTGALEAYGYGTAIEEGAGEFFNSSDKTLAEGQVKSDIDEDKKDLEEIEDNIEDAEKNLEALGNDDYDKVSGLYKGADTHDNKANMARQKADELKQQMDNSPKGKDKGKYQKQITQLERKAAKEEAQAKKMREEAEKIDEDGRIKKMIDTGMSKDELKNQESARLQELNKQKQDFYTPEAIKARINSRRSGTSKAQLQAKKNEIIQKLTQLNLENKEKKTNNSENNVLTTEDMDSIERTANKLMENISHGVLTGKGYGADKQRKLISNSFDMDIGKEDKIFKSIIEATSGYETEKAKEKKAEAYRLQASYGGNGDNLVEKEAQMLMDMYRAEGKYKASEYNI